MWGSGQKKDILKAVKIIMVEPPKPNTMYHMLTLGASKCMHVVHSVGFAIVVGFGWFYLMRLTHAKP